jgi:hypothetical protein
MQIQAKPFIVDYLDVPQVCGKYFHCPAYHATLSTEVCAKRYRMVNQSRENYYLCEGCPIGAKHAGGRIRGTQRLQVSFICSRCHQSSWRAAVKHRSLCITCWNREREVRIGQNRKGCRPLVKDRFWEIEPPEKPDRCAKVYTVNFTLDGREIKKKVSDTLEAILEAVREPGVWISRSGQRVLPGQTSMVPGV